MIANKTPSGASLFLGNYHHHSSISNPREQRAIRNRISALQSRIRQREHLQEVESDLSALKAKNFLLEEENLSLKMKITELSAALKLLPVEKEASFTENTTSCHFATHY